MCCDPNCPCQHCGQAIFIASAPRGRVNDSAYTLSLRSTPSASPPPELPFIIEEYKTLREEIGRFQTLQKQSLTASIVAITVAVLTGISTEDKFNVVVNHPFILLFLPFFLAPIGITYFEADISVFSAARYLGVNLKRQAKKFCPNEIWEWEDFRRAREEKLSFTNFGWSQSILFLAPSILCVVLFLSITFRDGFGVFNQVSPSRALGVVALLAVDSALIVTTFKFSSRARSWYTENGRLLADEKQKERSAFAKTDQQ